MNALEESSSEVEYVSAVQGAEILGQSQGMIHYLANQGQIRRGGKGQYVLADIVEIKKRRERGQLRKTYKKREVALEIDWASIGDLPVLMLLDYMLTDTLDLRRYIQYQKRIQTSDQVILAAFDEKDRHVCYGYVALSALTRQSLSTEISVIHPEHSEVERKLMAALLEQQKSL